MKSNNFDEYRNEIKYLLYGVSRKTLFIQYKLSSLLLLKSYPDRWVNNIYFDNINLDLFNQSIEGISKRTKVRLRWYGDFHNLENPLLELKSKRGHKNIKKSIEVFYSLVKKYVPKIVIVQGDTTNSAAFAYAANLNGTFVAHNEAGLRTFDKNNPLFAVGM